jgi:hypothetical protein
MLAQWLELSKCCLQQANTHQRLLLQALAGYVQGHVSTIRTTTDALVS